MDDLQFARKSLQEELQAINDYEIRSEKAFSKEFREVMDHLAKDEKEHVALLIGFILNEDPEQEKEFRTKSVVK